MTMQLGYAHAMAGEKAEAREMIDFPARLRRKTYVPSFYSGAIYTGLRDKDQAFLWLQRAYDERCDYLVHLNKSAPDPARLLQTRPPRLLKLPRPANQRLPMDPQAPRHIALAHALLEQLCRFHPVPFQSREVPPHPRLITHPSSLNTLGKI